MQLAKRFTAARRRPGPVHRHGLSLLEVLVSTAILVASVTAIMQVLNVGHNARLSAVLDAEAILRCEVIMGEIVAGVRPLAAGGEVFEDDADWSWTSEVSDQGSTSLFLVKVLVQHNLAGDQTNSSWSLTRYMRDPQLFLEGDTGGDE